MFFDNKESKLEKIPPEKKEKLFTKIIPIFAKQLAIEKEKITLESEIAKDLGADSLDTVELVMALEEEFNIEILDEDVENMKTIADVIVYLAQRKDLNKG